MQAKPLPDDGHQHVNGDGDPDLRFDSILGCAIEGLDSKMLLDPFEEQFDLPSGLVQQCDGPSWFAEVVGQEHELLARRRIGIPDATQGVGVAMMRIKTFQNNRLIETDAKTLFDRMGITALEPEVVFGSGDEEGAIAMNTVQSHEVQISPVHDVERPCFDGQFVEDVDIVNLAGGNNDKGWNVSMKVQQRMQFDRRFALSEFRPRKQRQAKIDRCGIQGVGDLLQFGGEDLAGIQIGRLPNQHLRKIRKDRPWPFLVCIRQRTSSHRPPNPGMVQAMPQGPHAGVDIAQAFPIGQLRKRHDKKLLVAGQRSHSPVPVVASNALVELILRKPVHQLRKHRPSFVHTFPLLVYQRRKAENTALWN